MASIVAQIEGRAQPRAECGILRDGPSDGIASVVAVVTHSEVESPTTVDVPAIVEKGAGGLQITAAISWIVMGPEDHGGRTKERIRVRPDDARRSGLDVELAGRPRASIGAPFAKAFASHHGGVISPAGIAVIRALGRPRVAVACIVAADAAEADALAQRADRFGQAQRLLARRAQ